MLLSLVHVSKSYGGRKVLNNVSFSVEQGEVVGLLGPNGAGKTTTIRVLTGLVRPDRGEVSLRGKNIWTSPDLVRAHVGYVADTPFLYPRLSAFELLRFVADIRRMPRATSQRRIDELLSEFELSDSAHRFIEDYSLGMKRKLAFCLAFLHRPDILILDEPLNGLDPQAVRHVKELFSRFRAEGRSVLMSTHLLDIAQQMCDTAVIINQGETVDTKRSTRSMAGSLEARYFALTGGAGGQ